MRDFKRMSVTELDKLYWDSYAEMRNCQDRKSYRNYVEIGSAVVKELESRGLRTIGEIAEAVEKESKSIN